MFRLLKAGVEFVLISENLANSGDLPINSLKLHNIKDLCKSLKEFYYTLSGTARKSEDKQVERNIFPNVQLSYILQRIGFRAIFLFSSSFSLPIDR